MRKVWLLLLGCILFINLAAVTIVHADLEMGTGKPISNPSFEQEAAGSIPGWTQVFGTGGVALSQVQKFDMNNSMRITDSSSTATVGLESTKEDAAAGISYKASAKVYLEQGTTSIYVRFYNGSNTLLTSFYQTLSAPLQTWTDLSVTGLAPTGTTYVSVLLYSSSSAVTTAYFDDVAVDQVIRNGGFEEAASGSSIPGWSLPYGSTGISVVTTERASGLQSFKLSDPSSTDAAGLESVKLPVNAGEKYRVLTNVKVTAGMALLYIRFWDSSGALLQSWSESSYTTNGWVPLEVIGTAPTGAATVSALLYSDSGSVTTAYFDDANILSAFTNLEEQVSLVSMYSSAIGTDASGNPIMTAGLYGNPASFLVIDIHNETLTGSYTLPDTQVPNSMVRASDGTIYASSGGATAQLYKYVPSTAAFSSLGGVKNEVVVYNLTADGNGNIYGGTYKNNKLFKRSAAGTMTYLMEPVDNEFYAKGVSFDAAANSLYVTTGTTNAHLYKYNLTTNTRSADLMPPAYANEEIADMTRVIDNKLFLRLVPSQQGLVLNKSTHAVEHVIPSVNSYEFTGKSPIDDKVYYTSQGILYSYDLSSQAETALVDVGSNLLAGTEFLQLNEPNLSGYSLVGMTRAGAMIKYNLQTGFLKKITLNLPEQPARIKYIIGGDDGKIYSSPFLGSGLGIYDPATGRSTQYSGIGVGSLGQVEGAGKMNGKLYFGVYPNANMFEYDPNQPYLSGTNPRNMFNLGAAPHEQDRPYAVLGVEAHNKLFIGTVPFYGSLQGAFSIYDFNTDTVQVNKNIIPNQSVISLAYHNGKVYGGTTIAGGLGTTPTATEAKLFIWDIATGQKTFETVPVAGKKSITSLAVGPDGNIWGFAEGSLFVFNTTTKAVTYSAVKFSVTYSAGKWADVFMELGPDGNFFGTITSVGKFFMLSPTSKNVTIMRSGPFELFAQDNQGGLYFVNNDTELWKYSDPHLMD